MAALQVGPSFVNQSVCEILGGWLEIFHAKKGESFYYNSGKNHYLSNCGKGIAQILWVATPPSF